MVTSRDFLVMQKPREKIKCPPPSPPKQILTTVMACIIFTFLNIDLTKLIQSNCFNSNAHQLGL